MSNEKIDSNDEVLFSEWLPISKFIVILFVFVLALLVSVVTTTAILAPDTMVYMIPIYAVLSLIFVLIIINYRGIQITITSSGINVTFGLLNKKTITFKELVASEVIQATIGKYFGLGVRMGVDKSLAFVTNFGDAVKLTYQENKLFVFSSKNSQEICNLLMNYIRKNK